MTTLTDAQLAAYARGAGWTGNDATIAVAVALAESRGRTDALNRANADGTTDSGVWQVNSVHNFTGNLFDPAYNAASAYNVWQSQGWQAWTTYNTGAYLPYMARAKAVTANGGPSVSVSPVTVAPAVTGDTPGNTDSLSHKLLRLSMIIAGAVLIALALRRFI